MANNKRWIVRLAQEEHDEKLLIRDDAEVRQEQDGCYVAAWVWVENAYIVEEDLLSCDPTLDEVIGRFYVAPTADSFQTLAETAWEYYGAEMIMESSFDALIDAALVMLSPMFGVWGPVANNEAKWILDAKGRIARFPTEATAQVCADEYSVINNLLGTPNAFRVEQLREG